MKIGQPEWQWTLAAVRVQTSCHDADSENEIANALVTGDAALGDSNGERRFASAIGSHVWVACLSGQTPTMLPPWQPLLVAVAQSTLLLNDSHQLGRDELPSSISAASGEECPRSTLACLMLDKIDGTSN